MKLANVHHASSPNGNKANEDPRTEVDDTGLCQVVLSPGAPVQPRVDRSSNVVVAMVRKLGPGANGAQPFNEV